MWYKMILYITTWFLNWNQQFTLWKYSLLKICYKIYVYSLYDYELFIESYELAKLLYSLFMHIDIHCKKKPETRVFIFATLDCYIK